WEYACRAGTTTAWNSGKDLSDVNKCPAMNEVWWYGGDSEYALHPVGQKKPNAWGLYDMHGNVFEWCSDWFGDYPTSAVSDPTGTDTGSHRVGRGGSWGSDARYCRSAYRSDAAPGSRGSGLGFRVALAQKPIEPQPLTITIDATKVFDGTPLVSDYTVATVEGLLSGDKLTSGVVTTKSVDKDSYSYIDGTSEITTPFDTAKGIANYIVTYVINQKIQAAGLIITINDTKVYDGTPLVSDYTKATTKGLVDGDYLTAGAVTTAGSDVGTYNLITTSITVPFQTANGIGNYFVIYAIIQKIIQSDHSNKTIPLAEDVNLDMIWIEPGTFIMGSPEDELGRDDKEVQHEVTLTQGYWMGKYEVTQIQYEAIMGTNPSWRHKGADLPVDDVSWLEAMEFCEKLTAIERAAGRLPRGYGYTLPTEEQWEYACRAGTTTALNSGKNLSGEWECPEMDEVGWYYCNSNDTTHPVGQKLPNAWGLYDMHGNVEEFCLDEDKDPFWKGWHVVCGGDYSSFADDCRSGAHGTAMNAGFIGKGFRVALAPVPVESKDMTIPLSGTVNLDMIWIEPDTFMMGSPEDELGRYNWEYQHQVTLTQEYWLGKYEVTQAQYEAVMGTNPSWFKGADLPVEYVTWNDAKDFCARLTAIERAAGRLPE
ncbi:MAG: SUMF1/EgtB/PvdO family nonheme iron enzyme, partial [Verrucomicrobia bacterium]|nr:SUMF1/EgtB/PvdO family nonheme iron enzyme [Verrucomicrobiota bacterium]